MIENNGCFGCRVGVVLRKVAAIALLWGYAVCNSFSESYVSTNYAAGDFQLFVGGSICDIYVSSNDWEGVIRAVGDLKTDIQKVTSVSPSIHNNLTQNGPVSIIVGTLGKSSEIDALAGSGKIDVSAITNQWESFIVQVVDAPYANIDQALVIAGSDKRGTIFGIYDLCEEMGVSPWHYWADSATPQKSSVAVKAGTYQEGPPSVQYRGIFINDERGFRDWANNTEGKVIGPETYEKVFELMLRLKANMLWPAMHVYSRYFNVYPENAPTADMYGIVMGSAHSQVMLRNSVVEWNDSVRGEYDYSINATNVYQYWDERAQSNGGYECSWSMGMRGKHDSGIQNAAGRDPVDLMKEIITDQRTILSNRVDSTLPNVFQCYTPYKEGLDTYNAGVDAWLPDDMTLIFPEDNYGFIRQLAAPFEQARSGGCGVYYHLSYYHYLWLYATPPHLIWEEMTKAYDHNMRKVWIVNVGDIKPAELGMEFFLKLGWDIEPWNNETVTQFVVNFCAREFGAEHAEEIAGLLLDFYTATISRRPQQFNHRGDEYNHYMYGDEAEQRVREYHRMAARAGELYREIPQDARDAFFQLVLYPLRGGYAHCREMIATQKYNEYKDQGRQASVNEKVDEKAAAYSLKMDDTDYFNKIMLGGKWDGIMTSTPEGLPAIPQVDPLAAITVPSIPAELKTVVEGEFDPADDRELAFSVYTEDLRFVDVINVGGGTLDWSIVKSHPWITLNKESGSTPSDERVWIGMDWVNVPVGETAASLTVQGAGDSRTVQLSVSKPAAPLKDDVNGYIEANGYVSIEAENFSSVTTNALGSSWQAIDYIGRTGPGALINYPSTAEAIGGDLTNNAPAAIYDVHFSSTGVFEVAVYRVPTLSYNGGVSYGISLDEGVPVVLDGTTRSKTGTWDENVRTHTELRLTSIQVATPGLHQIKLWMVDPAVMVDKIVVYTKDPSNAPLPTPREGGNGAFLFDGDIVCFDAETVFENSTNAYHIDRSGDVIADHGVYIGCEPDDGDLWSDTTQSALDSNNPELGWRINFPSAGTYKFWVKMRVPNTDGDSFHLGLNGSYIRTFNTIGRAAFEWLQLTEINVPSAGYHTLNIWIREDGIEFDRFVLTTSDLKIGIGGYSFFGPPESYNSINPPEPRLMPLDGRIPDVDPMVAHREITYVDADVAAVADGTVLTEAYNNTSASNWTVRTPYGEYGSLLQMRSESGELTTTMSGLQPGGIYNVFAFFWDTKGPDVNDWFVDASLDGINYTNYPASSVDNGVGPVYEAAALGITNGLDSAIEIQLGMSPNADGDQTGAGADEGNRDLMAVYLGRKEADGSGEIVVYIANNSAGDRVWYDGVGHSLQVQAIPPVSDKIIYVNADDPSSGGNTVAGSGDSWVIRSGYGAGGALLQFRGTNDGTDPAILTTTLTNLVPQATYEVWTYFWDDDPAPDWFIDVSATGTGFSHFDRSNAIEAADQDIENTWDINNATITLDSDSYDEGNRDMYAAPVGTMTADANGEIKVYVHNASVGNRVWYDGVGYQLLSAPPDDLITTISVQNGSLVLDWSAAAAILQQNTNLLDAASWQDVSPAVAPYVVSNELPQVFFRLRQP